MPTSSINLKASTSSPLSVGRGPPGSMITFHGQSGGKSHSRRRVSRGPCLLMSPLLVHRAVARRLFWRREETRNWEPRCDRKRFSNNPCRRSGPDPFPPQGVLPWNLVSFFLCVEWFVDPDFG